MEELTFLPFSAYSKQSCGEGILAWGETSIAGQRGRVETNNEKERIMKYKYRVVVTGSDPVGYSFVENLVEVANLGGTLDKTIHPRMSFPQQAVFFLSTDEEKKSKACIKYIPFGVEYTREQLEEMDWDTFRAELKKVGVIGKDRKVMIDRYFSFLEENKIL